MDPLQTLGSLGLELPSPLYIVGAIAFGIVGWLAWRRGRRAGRPISTWLGVALMLYPYGVSSTWVLYLVGSGLCLGLLADRA